MWRGALPHGCARSTNFAQVTAPLRARQFEPAQVRSASADGGPAAGVTASAPQQPHMMAQDVRPSERHQDRDRDRDRDHNNFTGLTTTVRVNLPRPGCVSWMAHHFSRRAADRALTRPSGCGCQSTGRALPSRRELRAFLFLSHFSRLLTDGLHRQSFLDTFLVALNPRNVIPELYSKSIAHEHAGTSSRSN